MKKRERTMDEAAGDSRVQGFLDMIAPSVIQFNTDHFICGNTYRCVWALREYPTSTEEQAILKHLGEKDGVTLRIYTHWLSAQYKQPYAVTVPGFDGCGPQWLPHPGDCSLPGPSAVNRWCWTGSCGSCWPHC